jgi:hypothetical protein
VHDQATSTSYSRPLFVINSQPHIHRSSNMARAHFVVVIAVLAAVALGAAEVASTKIESRVRQSSTPSCCGQRTFSVQSNAYEPVAIEQNSVFVSIQSLTGLNQSELAVQRATTVTTRVLQVLNSGNFPNITNIQQVGVQVSVRTNFTCDTNGNCQSIPLGYLGSNTISFNIPLSSVNAINLAILAITDTSIQSQQGFVPPEIFGAAQNVAIKRALTFAQYRAEQTVSGLPGVKIGLPISVVVSTNDYLDSGGSANGAVRGTADVVFELIPTV